MSILLRDPLMRELLLEDYERELQQRRHHHHHLNQPLQWRAVRQPVRIHRLADWPLAHPGTFGQALNDLQSVMEGVNEVIDQYQSSLMKDMEVGGMKTTRGEDGNLQVAMDVSGYKPEEVSVRLCDDNLVVEAKTESSEQDSYHKSEFKRWVKLPADCKHEAIKSTLTADNKLLIEVPMNKPIEDKRSRSIPINIQQKEAVEDSKKAGGDQQKQQQQQSQPQKK